MQRIEPTTSGNISTQLNSWDTYIVVNNRCLGFIYPVIIWSFNCSRPDPIEQIGSAPFPIFVRRRSWSLRCRDDGHHCCKILPTSTLVPSRFSRRRLPIILPGAGALLCASPLCWPSSSPLLASAHPGAHLLCRRPPLLTEGQAASIGGSPGGRRRWPPPALALSCRAHLHTPPAELLSSPLLQPQVLNLCMFHLYFE